MELRADDRIRWPRNDTGLGLFNRDTAEVASVRGNRVALRLGHGRTLELGRDDPQLRHLDHAWTSTVHAIQGWTIDNLVSVMEAKHPKLSTQKSFYVEISRARHSTELVTGDAKTLRETLETASRSGSRRQSMNAPRSWTIPGDHAGSRWTCDATGGEANEGA